MCGRFGFQSSSSLVIAAKLVLNEEMTGLVERVDVLGKWLQGFLGYYGTSSVWKSGFHRICVLFACGA